MSQLSSFGSRLQELFRPNETQEEFGKRVGINRNTIASYLKNKDKKPDTDQLIKISRACNVSTDWLLGLSDVRSSEPDVQSACKYTGLSEKAVENIKRYNRDDENSIVKKMKFIDAVNFMLENEISLMRDIHNYLLIDFNQVYYDIDDSQKIDDTPSFYILPQHFLRQYKLLDTNRINFVNNTATDQSVMFGFSFEREEYAGILLQRITKTLQKLRNKAQKSGDSDA